MINKKSAKFISFEGTEGVGKTTLINAFCAWLDENNIDYIRTREPGGSEFGERMRAILLDPSTKINDDTELLLMFTARADHLAKVILPALEQGQWVICDRFVDSSFAYQGFGRSDGDKAMLQKIEHLTTDFIAKMPDVTFWLDLAVEEGLNRANKRSQADRFEQEKLEFFQRVYQGYQYLAEHDEKRFKRINANGETTDILQRICAIIDL